MSSRRHLTPGLAPAAGYGTTGGAGLASASSTLRVPASRSSSRPSSRNQLYSLPGGSSTSLLQPSEPSHEAAGGQLDAPYLTNAETHLGRVTLTAPDNMRRRKEEERERRAKAKKKKKAAATTAAAALLVGSSASAQAAQAGVGPSSSRTMLEAPALDSAAPSSATGSTRRRRERPANTTARTGSRSAAAARPSSAQETRSRPSTISRSGSSGSVRSEGAASHAVVASPPAHSDNVQSTALSGQGHNAISNAEPRVDPAALAVADAAISAEIASVSSAHQASLRRHDIYASLSEIAPGLSEDEVDADDLPPPFPEGATRPRTPPQPPGEPEGPDGTWSEAQLRQQAEAERYRVPDSPPPAFRSDDEESEGEPSQPGPIAQGQGRGQGQQGTGGSGAEGGNMEDAATNASDPTGSDRRSGESESDGGEVAEVPSERKAWEDDLAAGLSLEERLARERERREARERISLGLAVLQARARRGLSDDVRRGGDETDRSATPASAAPLEDAEEDNGDVRGAASATTAAFSSPVEESLQRREVTEEQHLAQSALETPTTTSTPPQPDAASSPEEEAQARVPVMPAAGVESTQPRAIAPSTSVVDSASVAGARPDTHTAARPAARSPSLQPENATGVTVAPTSQNASRHTASAVPRRVAQHRRVASDDRSVIRRAMIPGTAVAPPVSDEVQKRSKPTRIRPRPASESHTRFRDDATAAAERRRMIWAGISNAQLALPQAVPIAPLMSTSAPPPASAARGADTDALDSHEVSSGSSEGGRAEDSSDSELEWQREAAEFEKLRKAAERPAPIVSDSDSDRDDDAPALPGGSSAPRRDSVELGQVRGPVPRAPPPLVLGRSRGGGAAYSSSSSSSEDDEARLYSSSEEEQELALERRVTRLLPGAQPPSLRDLRERSRRIALDSNTEPGTSPEPEPRQKQWSRPAAAARHNHRGSMDSSTSSASSRGPFVEDDAHDAHIAAQVLSRFGGGNDAGGVEKRGSMAPKLDKGKAPVRPDDWLLSPSTSRATPLPPVVAPVLSPSLPDRAGVFVEDEASSRDVSSEEEEEDEANRTLRPSRVLPAGHGVVQSHGGTAPAPISAPRRVSSKRDEEPPALPPRPPVQSRLRGLFEIPITGGVPAVGPAPTAAKRASVDDASTTSLAEPRSRPTSAASLRAGLDRGAGVAMGGDDHDDVVSHSRAHHLRETSRSSRRSQGRSSGAGLQDAAEVRDAALQEIAWLRTKDHHAGDGLNALEKLLMSGGGSGGGRESLVATSRPLPQPPKLSNEAQAERPGAHGATGLSRSGAVHRIPGPRTSADAYLRSAARPSSFVNPRSTQVPRPLGRLPTITDATRHFPPSRALPTSTEPPTRERLAVGNTPHLVEEQRNVRPSDVRASYLPEWASRITPGENRGLASPIEPTHPGLDARRGVAATPPSPPPRRGADKRVSAIISRFEAASTAPAPLEGVEGHIGRGAGPPRPTSLSSAAGVGRQAPPPPPPPPARVASQSRGSASSADFERLLRRPPPPPPPTAPAPPQRLSTGLVRPAAMGPTQATMPSLPVPTPPVAPQLSPRSQAMETLTANERPQGRNDTWLDGSGTRRAPPPPPPPRSPFLLAAEPDAQDVYGASMAAAGAARAARERPAALASTRSVRGPATDVPTVGLGLAATQPPEARPAPLEASRTNGSSVTHPMRPPHQRPDSWQVESSRMRPLPTPPATSPPRGGAGNSAPGHSGVARQVRAQAHARMPSETSSVAVDSQDEVPDPSSTRRDANTITPNQQGDLGDGRQDRATLSEAGPRRALIESTAAASVDTPGADEDVPLVASVPRNERVQRNASLLSVTDLDVLASRLEREGHHFDEISALTEFLGPAKSPGATEEELAKLAVGRVEVESRRTTREGKVRQRLSVVGVRVDRCAICLAQFRAEQMACVFPCMHIFHESCASTLLRHTRCCPTCRASIAS